MYNYIYAASAVWAFERVYRWTRFFVTRFGFHRPVTVNAEAHVSHGAILLKVPMGNASWEAGQHCYLSFWGANLLRKPWVSRPWLCHLQLLRPLVLTHYAPRSCTASRTPSP